MFTVLFGAIHVPTCSFVVADVPVVVIDVLVVVIDVLVGIDGLVVIDVVVVIDVLLVAVSYTHLTLPTRRTV